MPYQDKYQYGLFVKRVEIEQSILKRHGLLGKRTTDKERARLFAKAPSVFNIAYKRNPDLFKGDLRYA